MNADRGGSLRPGVAATIARVEVRRTLRATTDSVVQTALLAIVSALVFLPFGAAVTYGAYQFGRALAETDGATADGSGLLAAVDLTGAFRGGLAVAFLGVAALAAMRAAAGRTELDEPPFLLTGAPVATVVTGQLLAEWLRLALWVALPLVAIAGAVGVGAGTPTPAISIAVALLVVVGAGYPAGFALGFAIRHLATIVEPIARHRLALGALAVLVYVGLIVTDLLGRVVVGAYRTLQDSPLGWLGDVALVGLPGNHGSALLAVGGLGAAAVAFAAGAAATTAIARRNWFTDPPQPEDDAVVHDGEGSRLESALGSVARRSTTTVATTVIRRARRKPLKLVFAVYPAFLFVGIAQQAVQQGHVPSLAVPAIAVYGIWTAGSLVTLNPIGDLGDAAPSTVLSGMDGHSFVRGHLVVAVPVGLVLSVGATTASAALSPDPIAHHAPSIGLAAVGAVWAPVVAVGVGAAAPRFGSVAVFRNATATLPSKRAFATYSVGLLLVLVGLAIVYRPELADAVAYLVSVVATLLLPVDVVVRPAWVYWVAWVVVVLGAIAPFASYAYAVRAFDRFGLS